jgi:hypothetical protein
MKAGVFTTLSGCCPTSRDYREFFKTHFGTWESVEVGSKAKSLVYFRHKERLSCSLMLYTRKASFVSRPTLYAFAFLRSAAEAVSLSASGASFLGMYISTNCR